MVHLPSGPQASKLACQAASQFAIHTCPSPKPYWVTMLAMLRRGPGAGRAGWAAQEGRRRAAMVQLAGPLIARRLAARQVAALRCAAAATTKYAKPAPPTFEHLAVQSPQAVRTASAPWSSPRAAATRRQQFVGIYSFWLCAQQLCSPRGLACVAGHRRGMPWGPACRR